MSTPISALVIAPHGLGATGVRRISPSLANLQKLVGGFIEPLVKELPMEYAVEMNRLIELQMEGSVG